jgi:queuosine precursor transporter
MSACIDIQCRRVIALSKASASLVSITSGVIAMTIIVAASNFLVQYPINDWLTWGALTYPVAFLITDLTNRRLGPTSARRVVYVGFAFAVVLSIVLATPRIAMASGSAFLAAQLLDITVFNRLRQARWWLAPLTSSVLGSVLDTALFFGLAFAGTEVPWITLALGDLGVKLAMALLMLVPFRLLLAVTMPIARSGATP